MDIEGAITKTGGNVILKGGNAINIISTSGYYKGSN
jgi:hypothetical protein